MWLVVDLREPRPSPLTELRLFVVSDVLMRVAQRARPGRVDVHAWEPEIEPESGNSGGEAATARDLLAPAPVSRLRTAAEVVDRFPGEHWSVVAENAGAHGGTDRTIAGIAQRQVVVGTVHMARVSGHCEGSVLESRHLLDPLALRLALLRFPPAQPAHLSRARLNRAHETLQRWRFKVAGWADMPETPPDPDTMRAMSDRILSGLDTRYVLRTLHRLELDQAVPSGVKFAVSRA